MIQNTLIEHLKQGNACVGIIGLGYVGLPLTLRFAQTSCQVIGFDIDEEKIGLLNKGKSYIKQIDHKRIEDALQQKLALSTDFSRVKECDALIICVPTPLTKHFEPDLSYVRLTMEQILPYLRKGQVVSLESTTFPGTTEELIVPRIEKLGFTVGEDIFAVYSPER
ncbi:MAG: UDP-N-acetyl-D-glucosamine dehydrogenase, partial [Flavobacteriales bacterium]